MKLKLNAVTHHFFRDIRNQNLGFWGTLGKYMSGTHLPPRKISRQLVAPMLRYLSPDKKMHTIQT